MLGIERSARHLCGVKRPKNLDPPAYLSPSPPLPKPEEVQPAPSPAGEDEKRLDPTRYGDWEKKGIAVDF
jgi:hypothetical protein